MTTFKTFNERLISYNFSCYPYNIRKIGKNWTFSPKMHCLCRIYI